MRMKGLSEHGEDAICKDTFSASFPVLLCVVVHGYFSNWAHPLLPFPGPLAKVVINPNPHILFGPEPSLVE